MPEVDPQNTYWYSCYTALATRVERVIDGVRSGNMNFEEAVDQLEDYLFPNRN